VPSEPLALLVDVVAGFQALATAAGARRLTLMGTEPLRRASNAAAVAEDLLDSIGVGLHVITVDQEARLTFLGVTEGRTPTQPMMVVDIGGGSTEVCLYLPDGSLDVVAIPVGSARLTAAHIEHDPPTDFELDSLRDAAAEIRSLLPAPTYFGLRGNVLAVFVGGTATNVARLGHLTREHLAEDRRTLADIDAAQVTSQFGVRPRRARQLAAGVAIIDVLLEHFGLDEALASEASLRDGAIIADWHFGDEWPERLGELLG
jgi:exopolyphosphatase/guanosine-5'-triphosphate,3'-diphosphate pyrophosphatase